MSFPLIAGHVALHVSGIPRDYDEKKFLEWIQEQCGKDITIDSIKICRDATTHKPRGSGYVNAAPDAANKIKVKLNHKKLEDSELNITYKRHGPLNKNANLCVNNLNVTTDYNTFEKTFSELDDNKTVNIIATRLRECNDKKTKQPKKKVGYIQFESEDISNKIIEKFDGVVIDGSTVKVSVFEDYITRANKSYNEVFVANFTKISVDDLIKNFSKFGEVLSAFIFEKKDQANAHADTYSASITFKDHESAVKACKELNGKSLDNQSSIVLVTKFLTKTQRKLDSKRNAVHNNANNLFISGLPEDITYEDMQAFFSKFGPIDSLRIMYNDDKKPKGYGYCSFKNVEDTSKARNTSELILKGAYISIRPFIPAAQRQATRQTTYQKTNSRINTTNKLRKQHTKQPKPAPKTQHIPHPVVPAPAAKVGIEAIPQAELDAMEDEDKHETFGEKIYDYVSTNLSSVNAGKITGMILESFKKDYAALNTVIANGKIIDKINEAIEVLKKHGSN